MHSIEHHIGHHPHKKKLPQEPHKLEMVRPHGHQGPGTGHLLAQLCRKEGNDPNCKGMNRHGAGQPISQHDAKRRAAHLHTRLGEVGDMCVNAIDKNHLSQDAALNDKHTSEQALQRHFW
eukprot:CAMPEP_0180456156 /NCGR_PEP_ID=MMETSP1036_2-20121128/21161_1 /TAXON_ID=632150 /ORGANISM="Azadinium spinosum, Strain 3D9" /LENGTH=119 /DNA_ID=CAMNT_0022462723 /DNA_START=473 /DNA_END=832 /DNA_ORIENTATION=+